MSSLALQLFGSPRLEREACAVPFATRKSLALLAYLALTGRPHQREALAALLWPESSGERARGALRRTLVDLRHALGTAAAELVDATKETVALRCGGPGFWIDVLEVERLLDAAAPGPLTPAGADALSRAVGLYRDDLLAGFSLKDAPAFDGWQRIEAERLRRRLLTGLERLVLHHRQSGRAEEALAWTRRWLALDPLDESAHRRAMEILAWTGQRAAALAQFEDCSRLLREELGAEPQPDTLDLAAAIRDGRTASRPAPTIHPAASRLEALAVEGFVGRGDELSRIAALLIPPSPCRLLSLLGPGGVGKTALAVRAALRLRPSFQDGIHFVSLSGSTHPDHLPQAIAEALAIPLRGSNPPREQLLIALAERQALLVLDNFEHLLEAAELLPEILRRAPSLRLLVTSRERLDVQPEWCLEVEGLPYPDARSPADGGAFPAVELFLSHVRRVRPDLQLGAAERDAAARLCRLTEGLPLALELAAPWARVLPLADLVARLAEDLDLLTSTRRDLPQRHRSMRAVFDESWQRLDASERSAFSALTVFRGSFEPAAAETVAAAPLALLASLVDRSLLRTTPSARYELHDILRQFGAERLDDEPDALGAVRRRHALYYSRFLAARRDAVRGQGQDAAIAEIGAELDNLRVAWRHLIEAGLDAEIEAAAETLFHFYEIRCRFHEGERAFEMARGSLLSRAGEEPDSEPRQKALRTATLCTGSFLLRLGHYQRARQLFEEVQQLGRRHGADRSVGLALIGLAYAAVLGGEYGSAARAVLDGAAILAQSDEPWDRAIALHAQGEMAYGARRYDEAGRLLDRSLVAFRTLGDRRMEARVLLGQARLASFRGDTAAARRLFADGLSLCRSMDDRWGVALCLQRLAATAQRAGDADDADGRWQESLELCRAIGDRRGRVVARIGLLQAATERQHVDVAWDHLEPALSLALEIGSTPLLLTVLVAATPLLPFHPLADRIRELATGHPALTKETREALAHGRAPAAEAAGSARSMERSPEVLAAQLLALARDGAERRREAREGDAAREEEALLSGPAR